MPRNNQTLRLSLPYSANPALRPGDTKDRRQDTHRAVISPLGLQPLSTRHQCLEFTPRLQGQHEAAGEGRHSTFPGLQAAKQRSRPQRLAPGSEGPTSPQLPPPTSHLRPTPGISCRALHVLFFPAQLLLRVFKNGKKAKRKRGEEK